MCGIFGYVGKRENAGEIVLAGLKQLEYRGYDSWGIASFNGRNLEVKKEVGKIGQAKALFSQSNLALGQTRWATHGGVTRVNAHPHFDCQKSLAIVHNGIVENYQALRRGFKMRHRLRSQTDTEIIVHLIEEFRQRDFSFREAVRRAFTKLEGLNALVVLDTASGSLVAVKSGSPLVIGVGQGENLIASDALAVLDYTKRVIFLADNDLIDLSQNELNLSDVQTGRSKTIKTTQVTWKVEKESLGRFSHYLLKEIYDQPQTIERIIQQSGPEVAYLGRLISKSFGTYLIGCGTASYVCLAGTYLFSKIAHHHVNFSVGSEFNYLEDFITTKSLVIGVSQSGETADIIESISKAKKKGARIVAIVNVVGSTLDRLSNYKILVGAGQETAVISTKAFTGQVAILIYLAYSLSNQGSQGRDVLRGALASLKFVLNKKSQAKIKLLAIKISRREHVYLVGRGLSYPAALEAALKIKEASYIHAEGFAAGELKHGVIALIEKGTPVIVLAPSDETYGATIAGAMELKARGAFVIGLADQNNEVFDFFIRVPKAGVATIIPNVAVAQTLAYHLTIIKKLDPDKPRNLAKSVTVK